MVGFNRRFAPQVVRMRSLLDAHSGPKSMVMTVNAGAIPAEHWTQDSEVGGGRIIGEACHFIDLLRRLAGSPIVSHGRQAMASGQRDTVSLTLASRTARSERSIISQTAAEHSRRNAWRYLRAAKFCASTTSVR